MQPRKKLLHWQQEENKLIKQNNMVQESFGTSLMNAVRGNMRQYTMIAALLLIWMVFSILTNGTFLSSRNLNNLFLQMVTIAILTNGMVLVMVAGNIDLSVGSVCGTLGALAAWLMRINGMHPVWAILITLVAGLAVGCWHGFWIAFRGVPAFIVTLSSMIAFRGLTLLITRGVTIGEFSEGYKAIGQGYLPRIGGGSFHLTTAILFAIAVIGFILSEIYTRNKRILNGFTVLRPSLAIAKVLLISGAIIWLGMIFSTPQRLGGNIRPALGIPYAVLLLLAVAAIYTIITTRTPFGRHVYAIGGNAEAARLSGVNIIKTKFLICISMGLMSAVAAIVFSARLNAATTAAGTLFELDTIAACIIGGTSTAGGIGTIAGAIIGAMVMASLDNGMSLMNLPIMYQYIVKGMVLLFAVWVDIANRKK